MNKEIYKGVFDFCHGKSVGLMTITEDEKTVYFEFKHILNGTNNSEWHIENSQMPIEIWNQHKNHVLKNYEKVK